MRRPAAGSGRSVGLADEFRGIVRFGDGDLQSQEVQAKPGSSSTRIYTRY